jgi:NADPH:quinone reductase-like Zn-dependent oxidoreductase
MKAVVLTGVTPYQDVILSEIEVPKAVKGWVLVKVRAFGMNHSESILRLDEIRADYIQKPVIPGIECVGEVEESLDAEFKKGDKVLALMGGMGRSFNGSYAEYTLIPVDHLFKIKSSLPWDMLGAIPETYYTAFGSLFNCLNLKRGESLLIRGATCALGYASITIAKALGCKVVATTHRESKLSLLEKTKSDINILDDGKVAEKIEKVDKVLELVGPKTVYDSLRCVKKGGIVCNTGILGGVYYLNGFDPIKDIPNGVYLTGFFSNYPTKAEIDQIFKFIDEHSIVPDIGKKFDFSDIKSACEALDTGKVNGKIVVTL